MSQTGQGTIPFFDLTRQYTEIGGEIEAVLGPLMKSQQFILGNAVKDFETRMASYLNVPQAIGVASGTDALILLLRAAGLEQGEAVLVPSFTFYASASAICLAGGTPIWGDVDPDTFVVTADTLDDALRARCLRSASGEWRTRGSDRPVRGCMVVHLYGQMADMFGISEWAARQGLWIVEDACQAIGARFGAEAPGALSKGAGYSFFPTKNLGGFGDGGLVTTRDAGLADRIRSLRVHGSRKRYVHEELGYNSRLDALQAAVLAAKLPHLDRWNQKRREHARFYDTAFSLQEAFATPVNAPESDPVYHQYTIRWKTAGVRDQIRDGLAKEGIGTEVYYPIPQHRQEAFRFLGNADLPVTERLSESVLSLPVFPELTDGERERVARSLLAALADVSA